MRAVLAKQLRKEARRLSEGLPERRLLARSGVKKVKILNPKHPDFGNTREVQWHSAINDPETTRGIYRALKNIVKKGLYHAERHR